MGTRRHQWTVPRVPKLRTPACRYNYPDEVDPLQVQALIQLRRTGGIAALAELIEERLDRRAGRLALTAQERWIHQACRARFGHYDPTALAQIAFVISLTDPIAA